jgi:hypothetical protein
MRPVRNVEDNIKAHLKEKERDNVARFNLAQNIVPVVDFVNTTMNLSLPFLSN